jgi:DNA repair exonuclease SbcCD ATPase subunit
MKLLKLEVKNFKPFRDLTLPQDDIEFPNGLVIIKGPNSTGKSSLLESILWSLWGPDSIGLTNDELISFSSTFCHVILQFEVAGARYKVDRNYNSADGMSVVLFMKQGEAWKRIADKSRSVAAKLDEILCLELKQALNTLLVRQGEVAAIANSTPTVLRNLLMDIYDIDILKKMSTHLDHYESDLGAKIDGLTKDYRRPEDLREEAQRIETRIDELKESLKSRSEVIESAEKMLKDIPDAKSLQNISEITRKIEQDNRDLSRQSKQLEIDLSKAGIRDADETLIQARIDSLKKVIERTENEKDDLDVLQKEVNQEIGGINGTSRDLEKKIATLQESSGSDEDSTCPTCSQPLTPKQRDNLIAEYKKAIKAGAAKIRELEQKRKEYVSASKDSDKRVKELSATIDAATKVQETKGKVDAIQAEITTSEEELSKLLSSTGVKNIDVLLTKFNVTSLSELQMEVKAQNVRLNEAKKGTKEIADRIIREEIQISDLKGKEVQMEQMGVEIQEMKRLDEHAKYVRRKLVSGFVADYVFQKRLIGIIRSATNQYVRFFTNNQYTSIDLEPTQSTKRSGAGLLLKIWDERDQAWKKTGQLSYGDRTAISLGLRLGISRTMSSIRPLRDSPVITPRVRTVMLDEPLGGLDKFRREAVVTNLVNDKNFEQIFLITHTDVQGWEGVPVIDVAKEGSSSTATLEI